MRLSFVIPVCVSAWIFVACQEPEEGRKLVAKPKASAMDAKPKTDKSTEPPKDKPMDTPAEDLPTPIPLPMDKEEPKEELPLPVPLPPETKSEGCSAKESLAEGNHEFMQDKYKRKYIVHRPAGYAVTKPWPVVLALHPNGSNTSYWDGTTGDRAIRKLFGDKAIIVVVQAREGDWRGDLPTELAYFDHVLKDVKAQLCVDTSKIFSMGFSGGGSFSGVLGCMRSDIRAFASGGAVAYFEADKCVGKPASWITIGDKEAVDDRKSFRDFWRKYNSCTEKTVKGKPDTCVEYECADQERQTIFCSHPGDHVWPNFGSQAAWDFFSRYL